MKKIFVILLTAMMILSSVSLAEDLSSLSDEDLLDLYIRVREEMADRNIPVPEETPDGAENTGDTDEDAEQCVLGFFCYWSQNSYDDMLMVCAPDWKAKCEDPKMELFKILANRTPMELEVTGISGKAADTVREVTAISLIDRNNGREPARYLFRITVKTDADGVWYVDPESLLTVERPGNEPQAETTPEPADEAREISGSTVLYYCPEGGQYYHLDQNCKRVHEKFLPMSGRFLYSELKDEAYKDLQPCSICGAPERQAD